jgi:hypothetical protein
VNVDLPKDYFFRFGCTQGIMFCHIFNLLICKDFTKEANEIAAVGGGAFNVRKGKPLQTSPKGRLKRPHPTSHKGRRKSSGGIFI